jgi:hypothetical protein
MNHLEYEVARKHQRSAHKTTQVQIVANFLILLTQGEIRCVVLENYRAGKRGPGRNGNDRRMMQRQASKCACYCRAKVRLPDFGASMRWVQKSFENDRFSVVLIKK